MRVGWPSFDPAEAINQVITAAGSMVAVFLGAGLALRQARWQITTQRAFDRKAAWLEEGIALARDFELPLEEMFGTTRWGTWTDLPTTIIEQHVAKLKRHLALADVYVDAARAAEAAQFIATIEKLNQRWVNLIRERERESNSLVNNLTTDPGMQLRPWNSDAWYDKVTALEAEFTMAATAFRASLVAQTQELLGLPVAVPVPPGGKAPQLPSSAPGRPGPPSDPR